MSLSPLDLARLRQIVQEELRLLLNSNFETRMADRLRAVVREEIEASRPAINFAAQNPAFDEIVDVVEGAQ